MNYKLITHLLSEVNKVFEVAQLSKKQVILVLGNTGSGKSTLINHFLGHPLKKEYDEHTGIEHIILDDIKILSPSDYAKIGQKGSETTIPQIFALEGGEFILDMPGFADTRGIEFDIVLYLSIQMLIKSGAEIKNIIVLMTEEELLVSRGKEFWNLANTLSQMINSEFVCEFLRQNVIFGLTQCSGKRTEGQLKEKLRQLYENKLRDLSKPVISSDDLTILNLMEVIVVDGNIMLIDIFDQGESRKVIFEFIETSISKNTPYDHTLNALACHKNLLAFTTGIATEYINLLECKEKHTQEALHLKRKLSFKSLGVFGRKSFERPWSIQLSKVVTPILKENKSLLDFARETLAIVSQWENLLMEINDRIKSIEQELSQVEKIQKFEFLHTVFNLVSFGKEMVEYEFFDKYSVHRLDFPDREPKDFEEKCKKLLRFSDTPRNLEPDFQLTVNRAFDRKVHINSR